MIVFLIFLFVIGALVILLALVGLFFGGEDPYEKELARMYYEDEVLSRLNDITSRISDYDD